MPELEPPDQSFRRRPRSRSEMTTPAPGTNQERARRPDKDNSMTQPDPTESQPVISGLGRAIDNASPFDVANVRAAICDRAKRPGTFVIEDVFEDTGVYVDHPCRVGALTAALARERVIVRVGYTRSRRASRAGGVVAIWRGRRDGE
jgi:hypothetical protein